MVYVYLLQMPNMIVYILVQGLSFFALTEHYIEPFHTFSNAYRGRNADAFLLEK